MKHMDLREIPIGDLEPGQNPRTIFDPRAMEELTESVKTDGVLQPLEVRPKGKRFAIVFGERRYRAAKAAGLEKVPAIVVDIDDKEALARAVIENDQRSDMHPLDTARGYKALLDSDPAFTIDTVAARVGRPRRHIGRMLQLLTLVDEVQQAFTDGLITDEHAHVIAGEVPPKQQKAALKACFLSLWDSDEGRHKEALGSVRDLLGWVERNVKLDVRSDALQFSLPEIAEAVAKSDAAGTGILELARGYDFIAKRTDKGPLNDRFWHRITGSSDRCDHVVVGIVVKGGPRRALEVCATDGCEKHFPAPKPATSSRTSSSSSKPTRHKPSEAEKAAADRERKAAEKRQEAARRWKTLQSKLERALLERAKKLKTMSDKVAADIADDLNYDVDPASLKAIGKITAANFHVLATFVAATRGYIPDAATFVKKAKAVGIDLSADLKQFNKELDAEPAAKAAAAAKKPAKKGKATK